LGALAYDGRKEEDFIVSEKKMAVSALIISKDPHRIANALPKKERRSDRRND